MRTHSSPFDFPSALRRGEGRFAAAREDRGYALLIIMMVATILLISLTAALPSVYRAGQREREEELIFRGNEYARAIMLFQRQFRRYPASVKELLQTNGIRFLRREYRDPMSRKGKWRFIHANASGVAIDSKTIAPPKPPKPLGGATSGSSFGSPSTKEEGQKTTGEGESEPSSSFFSNEVKGAFIVGVASTSRKKSIRVWNGRTRYDEWEFLGLASNAAASGVPPAGQERMSPQQRRPGQGGPGLPPLPPLTERPLSEQ